MVPNRFIVPRGIRLASPVSIPLEAGFEDVADACGTGRWRRQLDAEVRLVNGALITHIEGASRKSSRWLATLQVNCGV